MLPIRIVAAVGLVAAALISLQISFTRLIGYKLFYHYVFLAIALSLLGLGAAGTYVAVQRRANDVDAVIARWLAFGALLVPVAFLAMANPPIALANQLVVKLLGTDALRYLAWCSLFMVALNFAGGVVLTQAFKTYSDQMGRLYAADLLGAGLGCLWSVAIMKYLSPPFAFVSTALLLGGALTAIVVGARRFSGRTLAGVVGLVGIAAALGVGFGPEKYRGFQNFKRSAGPGTPGQVAQVIKYEWNHIIRTDHIGGHYVLDGEASTGAVRWDPAQINAPVTDPTYAIVKSAPRVAIIGFGGGLQVAEARRAKAAHITAIDINPTISRWVLEDDRDANLGLFLAPNIEVLVGEGRHTIRGRKHRFDAIVMHAIDTYAATAAGAYALTENFLYTKEAMIDYLRALNPGGVMSIQRWLFNPPRENMRLFTTALAAFEELGYAEPLRHVIMLAPVADYEILRRGNVRVWGSLLISPTPFSPEQLAKTKEFVARYGWSAIYLPGGDINTPFTRYALAEDRDAFRSTYPYVIKPVTDASPYLFQYYSPFSRAAYRTEGDWVTAGIYQSSAITLLSALGMALVLSLLLIIAPLGWAELRARRTGQRSRRLTLRDGVFFACLGVGYMALEVPLIQVLALYLGHPVYGFSVVLVALLLASGVGSVLSQRLSPKRWKVCALISAVLAVVTVAVLPMVHGSIHFPDAARFGLAMLVVGLCGVPMGFPLALAVRELGQRDAASVAWAWGVNGAASVVGSCLLMVVMVFLDTGFALGLGALSYAIAAAMSLRPRSASEDTVQEAPPAPSAPPPELAASSAG